MPWRKIFVLWPIVTADWIVVRLWCPLGGYWTIHLIPDVWFLEWMHRFKLLPTRIMLMWCEWAQTWIEEYDDFKYEGVFCNDRW